VVADRFVCKLGLALVLTLVFLRGIGIVGHVKKEDELASEFEKPATA
jgi:hypothetical protein